eukprot:TRINITY_DN10332_c0_g3_i1.p1 TRINITY_DN10332_c0_g3~~TRINITY_DN10332_c0_g3_i1.p1  ORF type:complete len:434 (+),score=81.79 TRINITY_DN10332_c0_g3_i1:81-1382(+)
MLGGGAETPSQPSAGLRRGGIGMLQEDRTLAGPRTFEGVAQFSSAHEQAKEAASWLDAKASVVYLLAKEIVELKKQQQEARSAWEAAEAAVQQEAERLRLLEARVTCLESDVPARAETSTATVPQSVAGDDAQAATTPPLGNRRKRPVVAPAPCVVPTVQQKKVVTDGRNHNLRSGSAASDAAKGSPVPCNKRKRLLVFKRGGGSPRREANVTQKGSEASFVEDVVAARGEEVAAAATAGSGPGDASGSGVVVAATCGSGKTDRAQNNALPRKRRGLLLVASTRPLRSRCIPSSHVESPRNRKGARKATSGSYGKRRAAQAEGPKNPTAALDIKRLASRRQSGIRGVHWRRNLNGWVTTYVTGGRRCCHYFPVSRFRHPSETEDQAVEAALNAAVARRQAYLASQDEAEKARLLAIARLAKMEGSLSDENNID